jgi:hypothetical protein
MGIGIYFKIVGYVDLDMLQIFAMLKMCDNCVKSYSSWNAFFCWLTAFGYSNNQREATLLQNVK